MNYNKRYRWCVVSSCTNNNIKNPEKLFIKVPDDTEKRKLWLELAKRDPQSLSTKSRLFLCEDHFNLEQDMENYMEYKILGSVKYIKMKSNSAPSRLCFHKESNRKTLPNTSQSNLTKTQRLDIIQEADNRKLAKDHIDQTASLSKPGSQSKANTGHSRKGPHYLSEFMQFIMPFDKSLHTTGNMSDVHQSAGMDEEDTEDEPLCIPASENTDVPYLSTSCQETIPPNELTSLLSHPTSPSYESDDADIHFDKKRKSQNNVNNTIIEYFNAKKAKLNKTAAEVTEDHRKMFLLSLLPDLKIMTDAQMRNFKTRVLAVVNEILQETSRDPEQNLRMHESKQEETSLDPVQNLTMHECKQETSLDIVQNLPIHECKQEETSLDPVQDLTMHECKQETSLDPVQNLTNYECKQETEQ